jgi:hypothetical protein
MSNRVASDDIMVVILPTLCSARARPERRRDLRKIIPMTELRTIMPVVVLAENMDEWDEELVTTAWLTELGVVEELGGRSGYVCIEAIMRTDQTAKLLHGEEDEHEADAVSNSPRRFSREQGLLCVWEAMIDVDLGQPREESLIDERRGSLQGV